MVQRADAAECDRVLVDDTGQLTYSVSDIDVVLPPERGTVTRLEAGDRACYVEIAEANGNSSLQLAGFEICQQDIVGAEVRLTYETGNVLAASCQGGSWLRS